MEKQEIKLWAFYYNHMTWESSAEIVSYHRTKKGARLAMKKHKDAAKSKYQKSKYGIKNPERFGSFEAWYVARFTLKIED